jgi:hypothetical protein
LNMPNGFIDQFEDQTGVDDPSSAYESYDATNDYYGPLQTPVQAEVSDSGSTNIGDMTSNAGLAAAFNGSNNLNGASLCASGTDLTDHYVGKDWGSGNTKTLTGCKVWGSNNEGYKGGAGSCDLRVYGSNTAPTSATNGTLIATIATTKADINNSDPQEKLSGFITSTPYRYHWTGVYNKVGNGQSFFAEVEFYEAASPTISNMTLISETSTASASPDNAHIALFNQEVDALTLDTDIMAWASRSKQTFTATNATNVLNATGHGLSNGDRVMLTNSSGSGSGRTITVVNDTQHDTTQQKFGASSILFDGTNDHLTVPDSADWNFSGDHTIEMWVRVTGKAAHQCLFAKGTDADWPVLAYQAYIQHTTGKIFYQISNNGSSTGNMSITTTADLSDGAWHHTAFVRYGNVWNVYIDGTSQATTTQALTILDESNPLSFGAQYTANYDFNGHMDEIRVSSTARYTANFTPSTTKYSPDSNTLLLIHSDTTDASTTFNDSTQQYLPAGLTSEPVYYVVNKTTNTFKVSMTSGGSAVALTDDGSETHSVRAVTKAALVDRGDFETGKATLSALVDISGQPTDTDMSLIVQTKNNKETKLHGMSMQYT